MSTNSTTANGIITAFIKPTYPESSCIHCIAAKAKIKPIAPPISTLKKLFFKSPFRLVNIIQLMKIAQEKSISSKINNELAAKIQANKINRKNNSLPPNTTYLKLNQLMSNKAK